MPRRWGPKAPSDSVLTVGIKQGSATTVPVPFGNGSAPKRSRRGGGGSTSGSGPRKRGSRKRGGRGKTGVSLDCWNAFAEPHLALPRAVAPYTVIRTTAIWNPTTDNQRRFALFGPVMNVASDAGQWSDVYCLGANTALSNLRNATDGCFRYAFGALDTSSWQAASVVPAAFSIQILNPEALQTSTGMVYIGRCKNKVHLAEGDNNASWQSLCDDLVSYSNPRMCSAGKLALRGVHVDAVPNNMSELAKFTTLTRNYESKMDISSSLTLHQEGFNPIFIYNPNAVDLQVLVCCEWRVRFDPSNPAYAACKMHRPSTDASWADHMQRAVSLGNGVADIVEVVARAGQAVRAAGAALV